MKYESLEDDFGTDEQLSLSAIQLVFLRALCHEILTLFEIKSLLENTRLNFSDA